jgi:uncharacterized membrane protein
MPLSARARKRAWIYALDGLAVILMIAGAAIGAGSSPGITLIIVGVVLVQVAWIPVVQRKRIKSVRGALPDPSQTASEGSQQVESQGASRAVKTIGKWIRGEI